eukprot:1613513-Rhodomonas_salina.1
MELEGSDKWGVDKYMLLTELRYRVEQSMQHSKCSDYCHNAKYPNTCRFHFPFLPRSTTGVDPVTGILMFKLLEGYEMVVPYNPWVLMQLNCHCNVQ